MNVLDLVATSVRSVRPRADSDMSMDDWIWLMNEVIANPGMLNQTLVGDDETIEKSFMGLLSGAYAGNGVVFACVATRYLLFSQARIAYQQMRGNKGGDLFGTPELAIVERPWRAATTADLLAAIDLDSQVEGNGFAVRRPGRIERLRPDWTDIVIGSQRPDAEFSPWDPDAEFLGLIFHPGGYQSGIDPISYTAPQVMHYAPVRDPVQRFRGMSWMLPVLREIQGDNAAMSHKQRFFERGATPSMVITSDIKDVARWKEWVEGFREKHEGISGAYKTIHLQAGAAATSVGTNLQQLDFKVTQGHGETRIAAASGMHPVVVALSEGLQGSSLNAGNFREACQLVADTKLRSLWTEFCGSLESIIPVRPGTRLWYDESQIPFLKEDVKIAAEVVNRNMLSIESGIRSGYTPNTVRDAVVSGDLRLLEHTGLFSVQLQAPGTGAAGDPEPVPGVTIYQLFPEFATTIESPLPRPVGQVRAIAEFWPASGALERFGSVPRGTLLEADAPHVQAFPSMFEPAEARTVARLSGPSPIVSREQVAQTRAELAAAGRPSGYDAIASVLGVSATTVRRRLDGGEQRE